MLDGSRGNVLDLTLLGDADGYEHGSITLGGGVRVSDLTADDFTLDGDADPEVEPEVEPRPAAYDATYDEIAYQLTDGYWEQTTEDRYYDGQSRADPLLALPAASLPVMTTSAGSRTGAEVHPDARIRLWDETCDRVR